MDNTFIKLNRKILDWEWYGKPNTYRLFVHCLLNANWKEGKFQGKNIPRGSFVTSLEKLSKEIGLTIQEVRTSIMHLELTSNITNKNCSKYRIITVNNYDNYQDNNKQINKQSTSNQQAINKQSTTIEEKKELKEVKNKTYSDLISNFSNDKKIVEALNNFIEMRLKTKGFTLKALELNLNKLKKESESDWLLIINNSIMNSWKSFYPIKKNVEIKSKTLPGWYDQQTEIIEDDENEKKELLKRIDEIRGKLNKKY